MSVEAALGIGTAVAGIAGNAMNIAATGNLNRRNRSWQESMWNKQNEYNSPLAQKQRLEAAGVNPYSVLAQGGADTGLAGNVGTPNTFQQPSVDGVGLFSAAIQNSMNAKLLKRQDLENENIGVQNEFVRVKEINECQNLIEDWQKKAAERRKLNLDSDYEESQIDYFKSVLSSLVEQQESEARIKRIESDWKYQELLDNHLNSVVDRMLKQSAIEVNDANKASLYQGISESFQRISLMDSQKALNYEQVRTEIQKQATEICNRVLGRQASQRAWNDLYINVHNTLFDMWNVGRTMQLPFGAWRPALPGATKDLFNNMHVPYNFPNGK